MSIYANWAKTRIYTNLYESVLCSFHHYWRLARPVNGRFSNFGIRFANRSLGLKNESWSIQNRFLIPKNEKKNRQIFKWESVKRIAPFLPQGTPIEPVHEYKQKLVLPSDGTNSEPTRINSTRYPFFANSQKFVFAS